MGSSGTSGTSGTLSEEDAPTEEMTKAQLRELKEATERAEKAADRAEKASKANGTGNGHRVLLVQTEDGAEDGPGMIAVPARPQLPPGDPPKRRRDWTFWVPVSVLGVLAILGLLVGAYFLGVNSRPSDAAINARVANAVSKTQQAADVEQRSVLRATRKRLNARMRERVRSARASGYRKGRAAGYSSGQSAGYASGQSAGRSQGYSEGQSDGYSQGNLDGFIQGLDVGGY